MVGAVLRKGHRHRRGETFPLQRGRFFQDVMVSVHLSFMDTSASGRRLGSENWRVTECLTMSQSTNGVTLGQEPSSHLTRQGFCPGDWHVWASAREPAPQSFLQEHLQVPSNASL